MDETNAIDNRAVLLFDKISLLIEQSRHRIATVVNVTEVYTKYHIGQYIVEDEQNGNYRAQYGKQVLKNLSVRLTERFGKGWSVDTLENCRTLHCPFVSIPGPNVVLML